jgi:serine protease Do
MSSQEPDFCERNIKQWIAAIVVLSVFVLGYATWLAVTSGQINGFAVRERGGAKGAVPGTAEAMTPAAAVPAFAAPAMMAAAPVVVPAPPAPAPLAAVGQGMGAQGVAMTTPLNAVTRATPNGGIQFLGNGQALSIQTAFNQAADIIRPTVVNVNAVRPGLAVKPNGNPNSFQFIDPFDGVPDKVIGQQAYDSVGSGVIVDPRGYIITNYHVIAGATSIVVTRFNEPQTFLTARIVATDTSNDLALIQIAGDVPYPTVSMVDSSLVEVGDWVLAVGNPFGLEHTVTAGIVSAKRSSITIDGVVYGSIIQTDAPINRGSSGGPLVNLQGKMVGLNTAIYAPTGVFNGTGFAIPSNRVSAFVARVLVNQTTPAAVIPVAMQQPQAPAPTSVWLGVGVTDMTPDLASKLAFPFAGGAYVNSVILDSPADESQLTTGDIIASLAGNPLPNAGALDQVVATLAAGRPVEMTVWRGGKAEATQITPRPNQPRAP